MLSPLLMWWAFKYVVAVAIQPSCTKNGGCDQPPLCYFGTKCPEVEQLSSFIREWTINYFMAFCGSLPRYKNSIIELNSLTSGDTPFTIPAS